MIREVVCVSLSLFATPWMRWLSQGGMLITDRQPFSILSRYRKKWTYTQLNIKVERGAAKWKRACRVFDPDVYCRYHFQCTAKAPQTEKYRSWEIPEVLEHKFRIPKWRCNVLFIIDINEIFQIKGIIWRNISKAPTAVNVNFRHKTDVGKIN